MNKDILILILLALCANCFGQSSQYCFSDQKMKEAIAKDPNFEQRVLQIENDLYLNAIKIDQESAFGKVAYTIPVVLHVITPPGTPVGSGNNITEAQAEQGLIYLNDIFANSGRFEAPNGVDTEIDFCLAKRDPNNRPTNGITRTESNLVNENQCNPGTDQASDRPIKNLIGWDCRNYLNIWLVTDLFGGGGGCGLVGFAYFPGAGCAVDGIMVESRYWHSPRGAFIIAHEVGHYLGLYHTFQGGCANADCLQDGDRVCDTPPDDSQAFAPCGTNSCNTDNPNLPDDTENIMDYSNCQPMHFTQGQKDRMQNVMAGPRLQLSQSNACIPVVNTDVALTSFENLGGVCADSICPTISFRNVGLDDITELTIRYRLDAGPWIQQIWNGVLALNEFASVELPCIQASQGLHSLDVELLDPNNQVDESPANNSLNLNIELFEILNVTIADLRPARCQSNGYVELVTTGGQLPYTYAFEANHPLQTSGIFQLLTQGAYQVTVTDQNGCIDSIPVIIPDSCQKDTPRAFVLNSDARYNGSSCYTLTRDQNYVLGSMWYEEFITLEEDFVINYEMNLGCRDGSGADGIAFVFQPISTTIGVVGGGIGYQGIRPSVAVEFDTWQNGPVNDPRYDHAAIISNGNINHSGVNNLAGPVGIISSRGNVEDCNWRNVIITWRVESQTLKVFVDCDERLTYTGDIVQRVFGGDPLVYFGFTAATGGATNVHQVCANFINATDKIPNDTICKGDRIEKSAPSVFSSYEWTPKIGVSDPFTFNPIFTPDTTTTYYVRMSDQCFDVIDSMTIYVVELDILNLSAAPDSCGQLGSEITVTPKQNVPGLLYSIDGINYQSSNILIGQEGINTIYMKLGRCHTTSIIDVIRTPELKDSLIFQSPEKCNELGVLIIDGLEGSPPFNFSLDNGPWQNDGLFRNLIAGNHTYAIRDQKGCIVTGNIVIADFKENIEIEIDSSDLRIDCCSPETFIQVSLLNQVRPLFSIDGGPFDFEGRFENLGPGDHYILAQSDLDCPSDTLWFTIEEYTSSRKKIEVDLCEGKDTLINFKIYNTTGVFYDTIDIGFCCDSILEINLNVTPVPHHSFNYSICQGDQITVGSKVYSQEGIFLDTFVRQGLCDSIVESNIQVSPVSEENLWHEMCQGDELDLGYKVFTQHGLYSDTLTSSKGCDSIFHLDLKVYDLDTTSLAIAGCPGTSITIKGNEYNRTGSYDILFSNQNGCDSLVQLELNIHPAFDEVEFYSICPGETLRVQNIEISDTGQFTFNYLTVHSCDSSYNVIVDYAFKTHCDSLKKIFIPNVFTPDNNGLNDRFTVFGNEQLQLIKKMEIYDRWGELVFTAFDLPPNNTQYGWDGTFRNEKLMPGVYVYQVQVELISGSTEWFVGDVTLLK